MTAILHPCFYREASGITITWSEDGKQREIYRCGDGGKAILAEFDAATDGGAQVKILERVIGEGK